MASLNKTGKGWTVQVSTIDGKRKSVRLGQLSKSQAETIRDRISQLNAAQLVGLPLSEEVARWLISVGDTLHDRIAATGLTEARSSNRLGAYLTAYQSEHGSGVSEATRKLWGRAAGNLLTYFTAEKRLQDITNSDAKAWREWMLTQLAENTVRRRTGHAFQMLAPAVKSRRLMENPFDGLPMTVLGGQNEVFVSVADMETIFAQCSDPHARLYLALARFGGLRCPSEVRNLYWSQVKWEEARILITAPKTARYVGKGERYIPLFKSLEPYLLECFSLAPDGDSPVIPKLFDSGYLKRVVEKCGIEVWDKFFQSLRSSRDGELKARHPENVVACIMGHSVATSRKYYANLPPDAFNACVND